MNPANLGLAVEKLAEKLSDNTYRFILLFLFFLGSVVGFVVTKDLTVSILFFALAPMLLLFGLLRPEKKPRGWKAIWTFYLFMSYVLIAIIILLLVFYLNSGDSDLSREFESDWQKNYSKKHGEYLGVVENIALKSEKHAFFQTLDQAINNDMEFRSFIISELVFLENWEKCRQTRCRLALVHSQFDERVFEFWGAFRCYLASLRGQGYKNDFGRLVELRYEAHPEVQASRNSLDISANGLRVCQNN